MRNPQSPDFIEAIARGFDVLRALGGARSSSLSDVASASGLARPTARRILITLTELGYVRADGASFSLTPRILELGAAFTSSSNIWELTRPRLTDLVEATRESSSIAQLDGSDIVYVSRVAVPKLVALSVSVGTLFPAVATSLGKVLLAALTPAELDATLALPSRSGIQPTWQPDREELDKALRDVRARGWAITDQALAPAIRSIAAPVRDGDGRVVAAVNINAHAMETSIETLSEVHLPKLLTAAAEISADWANWQAIPETTLRPSQDVTGAVSDDTSSSRSVRAAE